MQIYPIEPQNPREARRFIRFPNWLYRDNPYWVPPMESEMKTALDSKAHPFYEHSEAVFLLAKKDNKICGRIAILDNHRSRERLHNNTGFFAFFEVVNDIEVARGLFEAGFEWARQRGIDTLSGPKGLTPGDGSGMLVEGFDFYPALGIPYNLPYYPNLLEELGFEKEADSLSGYIRAGEYELPERVFELTERVKARRGFHVLRFTTKNELREWIRV
ncbi:MAG: hypothetical protein FJ010_14125 [Chloroflexi bacterium]|nr:hypothetical protein [Chloroflexota bacterium]